MILDGTSGGISLDNRVAAQGYGGSAGTYEEGDHFGSAVAAIPTQTAPAGLIFTDGFEAGGTSGWSATNP